MTLQARNVVVRQVPELVNKKCGHRFFNELESCMNIDRPSIVFDCSRVRQMDKAAVYLLLCCLEEAMKRNGDVKLAGIPSGARAQLELTGAHRLFEMFDTEAEAVSSFRKVPSHAVLNRIENGSVLRTSENVT